MSKLFIIGTPIGNLEDMTLRAIRVLKEVGLILCEDTRVTKKLLSKYAINTPVERYDEHSHKAKLKKITKLLEEGSDLALVTDAGTPGISDPGHRLVSYVRQNLEEVDILSVPGPSALTSALSISGIPSDSFLFLGFFPTKKGREKLLKEILNSKRVVVFYESPHRIMKVLALLIKTLPSERKVLLFRELTKIYEEVIMGSPEEVSEYLGLNNEKIRGEFVVVVAPPNKKKDHFH